MSLQRSDLARLRLVSQGLIEPWESPAQVVRAFGCTQGQDLPGSTLSLALSACHSASIHGVGASNADALASGAAGGGRPNNFGVFRM